MPNQRPLNQRYRMDSREWKELRAQRRAQFLDQLTNHLPARSKKLKEVQADLQVFDQELRAWWTSPAPRAECLADILSRLTKAEVQFHRRIQAELGLPLEELLPGMLPEGWWEAAPMNERVRRRFRKRFRKRLQK